MWCGQRWKVQQAIKSKALCRVTYEREILNEMQFINIIFSKKKKKQTYWITHRCLFICERPIEAHISVALFIKQHGTAENQSKEQQTEERSPTERLLPVFSWLPKEYSQCQPKQLIKNQLFWGTVKNATSVHISWKGLQEVCGGKLNCGQRL